MKKFLAALDTFITVLESICTALDRLCEAVELSAVRLGGTVALLWFVWKIVHAH